jgi:acyl-CoA synthetase (NDP forming)
MEAWDFGLNNKVILKTLTVGTMRPAIRLVQAKRWLNLHEYQSKQLMAKYGVNTQQFRVSSTPDEAYQAAKELSTSRISFSNSENP